MSEHEFEINENGVLTAYRGHDKDVTIPDGVVEIGYCPFEGNQALETVVIPESVREIGDYAFNECRNLRKVTIYAKDAPVNKFELFPPKAFTVGKFAFAHCPDAYAYAPFLHLGAFPCDRLRENNIRDNTIVHYCQQVSDGDHIDDSAAQYFHDYIKRYRKDLYEIAIQREYLLDYMLSKQLIPLDEVNIIIKRAQDEWYQSYYSNAAAVEAKLIQYKTDIQPQQGKKRKIWSLKNLDAQTAKIISYSGTDTVVNVPDVISKRTVVSLGTGSFSPSAAKGIIEIEHVIQSITQIALPDTISYIETAAFMNCENLEAVNLGKGIKEVEKEIFCDCPRLNLVIMPETSEDIPELGIGPNTELRIPSLKNLPNTQHKRSAVMGFCHMYADGESVSKDTAAEFQKYIKGQRKKLYDLALQNQYVLQYMIGQNIIAKDDIDELVEKASDPESKAALMEYQSSHISAKARAKKEEKEMELAIEGAMTAAAAKKIWSFANVDDGSIQITGYKGSESQVEIPARIGTRAVTGIGDYAFSPDAPRIQKQMREKHSRIERVSIPDSVREIGEGAFMNCTELSAIQIPENIVQIKGKAFAGCSTLKTFTFPNGIAKIEDAVLAECTALETVSIPDGVTEIGAFAFSNCENLKSIDFPAGVTLIGAQAFYDCKNLSDICLPPNLKELPGDADLDDIGYLIPHYEDRDAIFFRKSIYYSGVGGTFHGCSNLKTITIPEGVTKIGAGTFSNCENLTEVNIPDSVTVIENNAFYGCSGLKHIQLPKALEKIEGTPIDLRSHFNMIRGGTFYGCSNLEEIVFPESLTEIGAGAFMGCEKLQYIVVPNAVENIYDEAFRGCTQLKKVDLPSSLKVIRDGLFMDCKNLTDMVIPNTVEKIITSAFKGCKHYVKTRAPKIYEQ